MSWQLTDLESQELIEVSSCDEIVNRLRAGNEFCKETPQIVELVAENGDTLAIGLGNHNSFLNM